jgi:hypothetical protein
VTGEMLTPTGAAILTTLSAGFRPMPEMVIEQIGYGAGTSEYEIPNLLRLMTGHTSGTVESQFKESKPPAL